jgi:AraC-like DNA-binding protein
MQTQRPIVWEGVSSLVDRQINSENVHVWPFPRSCPVDVRFLILNRHDEVPMHRPDHLEVAVYEWGELGYEVENRSCRLRKNDVVVVGNRFRHRSPPVGNSRRESREVVLSFQPSLIDPGSQLGDDLKYLMPFKLPDPSLPNVISGRAEFAREIRDFMGRIHAELPGTTERSRLAIKTYVKMILMTLVNYYSELNTTRGSLLLQESNLRRLVPVLDYIEQHYHEPIRVSDAARRCAMSDGCFMHFFKEVTDLSFVAYLNRFRVARAQNLLASTNKTTVEIGLESGFCNQSYFGVIFRRYTGMTPLKYRLQHSKARLRENNADSF